MVGSSGDDRMIGGRLPDTFMPGPGHDIVEGHGDRGGGDGVDYQTATRGVIVDLARGYARGQGYDRLFNIEDARGSMHGDVLLGSCRRAPGDIDFGITVSTGERGASRGSRVPDERDAFDWGARGVSTLAGSSPRTAVTTGARAESILPRTASQGWGRERGHRRDARGRPRAAVAPDDA
jgi:hypothetical protein